MRVWSSEDQEIRILSNDAHVKPVRLSTDSSKNCTNMPASNLVCSHSLPDFVGWCLNNTAWPQSRKHHNDDGQTCCNGKFRHLCRCANATLAGHGLMGIGVDPVFSRWASCCASGLYSEFIYLPAGGSNAVQCQPHVFANSCEACFGHYMLLQSTASTESIPGMVKQPPACTHFQIPTQHTAGLAMPNIF
jgi:hypothetical protein